MANYYQKLALVFWKAGNHLFHASALFRYFHLAKDLKKNITQEEIQRMASRVVLATLAVPMPPNRPEIDRLVETEENVGEKNQRLLATLLGLNNPPTRASLVKELDSTKDLKMHIIEAYRLVCKKEHKKILERQQIIEARKEMLENLTFQRVGA
ncbi:hypothetical protein V5799_032339 [Amblyomma americanum]|uniref:eIF3a PCI domain-containing protein n=1 Tax=Amblyomma americanum TaxID=6943 RepID=A0AAQ4DRG3_AMBAM